jgi:DNA-binding beta-propeller fold protein YncE
MRTGHERSTHVRRRILICIGLAGTLALAPGFARPAAAATFAPAPIAPDLGLDALTRRVTREQLGRNLFGDPWATVTLSHVDVYDRFPFVESRHFLVVSDPAWNRLVYGEVGKSLTAFDGGHTATGALASPRGLAVDDQDRVYVADAGNGRVLVLQASTEFDRLTLTPLYAIDGLSDPSGVAWSDGGTPFAPGDDALFVAETGRNRVAAYALGGGGARLVGTLGTLGAGDDRFAGPLSVAVGRESGASTGDVYVADAHNRRIVRLGWDGARLAWRGSAPSGADAVPSLATDEWGNVYAAAPQQGVVLKFNAALEGIAELRDGLVRPRALTVPYFTVRDHRDSRVVRSGQPVALVLEPWGDATGLRAWDLGVSVEGLAVAGADAPVASFTLTDRARVALELADRGTGRVLAKRDAGTFAAGHVSVPLTAADLVAAPDHAELVLKVTATPAYASGGSPASASVTLTAQGGGLLPSATAMLLPAWPNPARFGTRFRFALPAGAADRATLTVLDPGGRRVRAFAGPFTAGINEIPWDGLDGDGRPVRSGLYFYELVLPGTRLSHRFVVVR